MLDLRLRKPGADWAKAEWVILSRDPDAFRAANPQFADVDKAHDRKSREEYLAEAVRIISWMQAHLVDAENGAVFDNMNKEGKIVQKYVVAKALIKDVLFEETYDPSLKPEGNSDSSDDSGSSTSSETAGGGSSTGSETAGGDPQNPGGGDDGLDQD